MADAETAKLFLPAAMPEWQVKEVAGNMKDAFKMNDYRTGQVSMSRDSTGVMLTVDLTKK